MTNYNGTEATKLSYVRKGHSVDTTTGKVYNPSGRCVGFVTERWMRSHGWIA